MGNVCNKSAIWLSWITPYQVGSQSIVDTSRGDSSIHKNNTWPSFVLVKSLARESFTVGDSANHAISIQGIKRISVEDSSNRSVLQ